MTSHVPSERFSATSSVSWCSATETGVPDRLTIATAEPSVLSPDCRMSDQTPSEPCETL